MDSSQPLMAARQLKKTYLLWNSPWDRLLAIALEGIGKRLIFSRLQTMMQHRAERRARTVEALKPLDFELNPGESLGIIGRNGSGKSTLLKLLAGTLTPTGGQVFRRGKITALLELGSGFNAEFTGRENVRMQGALYGFSKEEIEARMPEVEAFAEIGDFIEQPVKTYSSGMLVRLAFAAQTIVDPDVCIVDEALSVGDVFFHGRCSKWFREKIENGMSLILVSHDLPSVRALCANAIVLKEGQCIFQGPSSEAVNAYHEAHENLIAKKAEPAESAASDDAEPPSPPERPEDDWIPHNWESSDEFGTKEAEIVSFELRDQDFGKSHSFLVGEPIILRFKIKANEELHEANLGFQVLDRHSRALYGYNSRLEVDPICSGLSKGEEGVFEVEIAGKLGYGDYIIDAALVAGDRGDGAPEHHFHRVGSIAQFSVRYRNGIPQFLGVIDLEAKTQWQSISIAK